MSDELKVALVIACGFWLLVGLLVWFVQSGDRAEIDAVLRKVFRR